MSKLLVATTNQGKLAEFVKMFEGSGVEIISLDEVESVKNMVVVEDGKTFKENAMKKAREYGQKSEMLTVSDDSGLMVDALDGEPGVYSKRYGKNDKERYEKLLKELEGVEESERKARFIAVLAVYDPEDDRVYTSEGVVEGRITQEPVGDDGFGYDPVFFSTELNKTFAQASKEEKNAVSHRGKAMRIMRPIIIELTQEEVIE